MTWRLSQICIHIQFTGIVICTLQNYITVQIQINDHSIWQRGVQKESVSQWSMFFKINHFSPFSPINEIPWYIFFSPQKYVSLVDLIWTPGQRCPVLCCFRHFITEKAAWHTITPYSCQKNYNHFLLKYKYFWIYPTLLIR